MRTRLLAPMVATALMVVLGAGGALAAPSGSNSETIMANCSGDLGTVTLTVHTTAHGNENVTTWNPGFLANDGHLIPLQFTFTFMGQTMTATKGNALDALQTHQGGQIVRCTFGEDGFSGEVIAFMPGH